MAAPGRSTWDFAIAVQEWAPLHAPGARLAHPDDLDGVRRTGRLARAYGLEPQQADELVDVVFEERAHHLATIRSHAAAGIQPWATSWLADDGERRAAADDAWLRQQRRSLLEVLSAPA